MNGIRDFSDGRGRVNPMKVLKASRLPNLRLSFRCQSLVTVLLLALAGAASAVVPASPKLDATAHVLEDFHSGTVLSEFNADARLEPASLTKMMTVYVAFAELQEGNITLEDQVLISKKAWKMTGSRMFIKVDSRVRLEDLMKGIIIQSGNDASVAVAEYIAGDERTFAGLMNQYAANLGMTATNFINASGLPDPNHYTSARDMAKLAKALILDFPQYYGWHAVKEFTFNEITQQNRNTLIFRDSSVDGIKTGHTKAAGYCLVASAKRDDMRLISVLMGSSSERARARSSEALLAYGFRFFETRQVYGANDVVTEARVWQGQNERLQLGLNTGLYVTVPRGQFKRMQTSLDVEQNILAPVGKGEQRGRLMLSLDGESIADEPLVALERVDEGNLWQRLTDYVRLMFN